MDAVSDADLLTACHAGDREAYAALLARHHGLVRAACLRQAPPGEADDCVQAVFLVLMRRPAAAARAPALAAWLLRVCWYVCRAAQRAARSRRTAERQAASRSTMSDHSPPEALDHLDDCLARLPERQRVAISLQYLAGKAPDDVANELGVSRDNAYQLVSRGLVALRTLLARRGIAITAPALALMLTEQGQAAVSVAAATSTISTALSAAPSAHIATLATGAATAMTVSAIVPFAAVAGLLLPLSAATIILAADPPTPMKPPAPAPAQTPTQPPTAQLAADWKARLDAELDQEITVDFTDMEYTQVITFLQRVTNQNIVVLPVVMQDPPGPVTLRVARTRIRDVFALLDRQAKTTHSIRDDVIVITRADLQALLAAPRVDLAGLEQLPQLKDRLQQRITFDLVDTLSGDFVGFLRQVSGINVLQTPAHQARRSTFTLKVKDMPIIDALKWICELTDSTLSFQNNALVFDVAPAAGVVPAGIAPPSAVF